MPPRRPSFPATGPGAVLHPRLALALAVCIAAGCDDGDAPKGVADALLGDAGSDVASDAPSIEAQLAAARDAAPEAPPTAYPRPQYQKLSETGLYADFTARALAHGVRQFRPVHQLWSDAADKARWVRLPEGTRIDTTEMDHWQFPVGTKLWKQFGRDGAPLETRLIERYGPGPEDYWMGAFVWSADGSDASFAQLGVNDINGTTHDAPAAETCLKCHRGDKGRVLGLSAVQSSHPGDANEPGLTLARLAAQDLLTHPPTGPAYAVPGDSTTAAALGYLHANCGHCHNREGAAWPDTQAVMRLVWAEREAPGSAIVRSLVSQRFTYWRHPTLTLRVAPGDIDQSAVVARMKIRGRDQMPPLATELVDNAGLEILGRWIASLPRPVDAGSDGGAEAGVDGGTDAGAP